MIVLDTAGARTYHQELGDQAVIIFLTVSQLTVLAKRMTQRGDQHAIESRLHSKEYHRDLSLPPELTGMAHVITNDQWSATCQQLDHLVGKILAAQIINARIEQLDWGSEYAGWLNGPRRS